MNIDNLLYEEIQNEFDALAKMEAGSDAYRATVDGLSKLCDRAIEITKFDAEAKEREFEKEFKLSQAKEEKKNRLVGNILTGVGIAVPAVLTVWGTFKSFEFEKEGSITTIMGRGFINKLIPKK